VYEFNEQWRGPVQTQSWDLIPVTLSQLAVGADGSAWGINSADQIYQLAPTQPAQTFHEVPAFFSRIAVGIDGEVWGIDSSFIYHFNSLNQNWDVDNILPGSLTQIAVGFGGNVWGIEAAGQIWRFNASARSWEPIPGLLSQIAVGTFGESTAPIRSTASTPRFRTGIRSLACWPSFP
jgi:hypothetical protein